MTLREMQVMIEAQASRIGALERRLEALEDGALIVPPLVHAADAAVHGKRRGRPPKEAA